MNGWYEFSCVQYLEKSNATELLPIQNLTLGEFREWCFRFLPSATYRRATGIFTTQSDLTCLPNIEEISNHVYSITHQISQTLFELYQIPLKSENCYASFIPTCENSFTATSIPPSDRKDDTSSEVYIRLVIGGGIFLTGLGAIFILKKLLKQKK